MKNKKLLRVLKILKVPMSSKKIVLEEYLDGEEASYFISDKNSFKFFGTAQDHKRVGENDRSYYWRNGSLFTTPIINKERKRYELSNQL